MKNILIVSHAMNLGGIERSLLGLLQSIDYTKYHVDLFFMRREGELLSEIPQEVNILPCISECECYAVPLKTIIKKHKFLMAAGRAFSKIKAKSYLRKENIDSINSSVELEYSHKYTMPFVPQLIQTDVYDLAISFATPHYFVRDKVKAFRKVAWIHTDYQKIKVDVNSELGMWDAFDYIAGVSESCVANFNKTFPTLAKKTTVIENILVPQSVRSSSLDEINDPTFVYDAQSINLLSVGRFDPAKNFEAIPQITRKLLDRGLNINWYIIGFGKTEEQIRSNIEKYNVSKQVHILGKRDNPYPYMKACDVYLQLSLFEGKCVSVREAQCLGKPVIIANYATAKSQVENGVNGFIVEQDIDKKVDALYSILNDTNALEQVANNCWQSNFGNEEEVEKIYTMIEGA